MENPLKKMRLKAGMTQEIVAKKLGLTQGAVSQWETGESAPNAKWIPKIAALYGCTVDELFKDTA